MKKFFLCACLCGIAVALGVMGLGERKAAPAVTQASNTDRKTVNREILESAERLSRTLENCKTTVKTNSVTR